MSPAATLHYIYDPFCGWCYAAAPLVQAARGIVPVRLHGGGMLAGDQRRRVTPQWRDYVLPHDRRIEEITGQPFGEAYVDGLLRDTSVIYDSAPPIAAILAAEQIAGKGADLLARLQTAHYVDGFRIAQRAVLVDTAVAAGLDATAFAQAFDAVHRDAVWPHIAATRHLMARWGGKGFPTFAFERDGEATVFDAATYLGRPQAFADWLASGRFQPGAQAS